MSERTRGVRGSRTGRPIMAVLDLLGRRWMLRILWQLRDGPLTFRALREREIVIDRVCARCGCGYEWGVHVAAFGAAAGLDDEQVAATYAAEPPPGLWSAREDLLLRAVDELHDHGRLGDALWGALVRHFDERQLLEVLVLCGWYRLISLVANGVRVEHEAWAPALPEGSTD